MQIPEPAPLQKYLPPQLWGILVAYLVQAAIVATASLLGMLGIHSVPAAVLNEVGQVEVGAAVALLAGLLGSAGHAIAHAHLEAARLAARK